MQGSNTLLQGGQNTAQMIQGILLANPSTAGVGDTVSTAGTPQGWFIAPPDKLDIDIKEEDVSSLNGVNVPVNLAGNPDYTMAANYVIKFSGPNSNGTVFVNAALVLNTLLAGGISGVQGLINSYGGGQ